MLLKLMPVTAKGMALKRGTKLHGERNSLRETEDVKGETLEVLLLTVISLIQIFLFE